MALADIIRKGVAIASTQVESVKDTVMFYAWTGESGRGAASYAAGVPLKCIVDRQGKVRANQNGQLVTVVATLTILEALTDTTPTPPWVRQQPVDPRDKFVLADGFTAPVVGAGGVTDPLTGHPFALTVELGTVVRATSGSS